MRVKLVFSAVKNIVFFALVTGSIYIFTVAKKAFLAILRLEFLYQKV